MNKNKITLLILSAAAFAFSAAAYSATLNVVSFNILAPPWAKPSSYPASSAPYLNREVRRAAIINTLNQLKGNADVMCLEETTPVEIGYIAAVMKDFTVLQANHDPEYWSQYITENPPWEPNGVAVFVKKGSFKNIAMSDQPLSESGNHGALMTAKHKATNKDVRVLCTHFDSDTGGNRKKEMDAALALMGPSSSSVDIIAGDFNSTPEQGNYQILFNAAGFTDVLAAIGNNEYTTPYTTQYSSSNNFGKIDHVTARNATPLSGDVIDNNLFTLYPNVPGTPYEDARITENMRLTGSDHFPVWGSVTFNP